MSQSRFPTRRRHHQQNPPAPLPPVRLLTASPPSLPAHRDCCRSENYNFLRRAEAIS
jgi:hypothetical protein